MKILIIAKSVDGGTGTFISHFLKIREFYGKQPLDLRIIALEEPRFRKPVFRAAYIHPAGYYPSSYRLSLRSAASFIGEWRTIGKSVAEYRPDMIISIDLHSNLLALLIKRFNRNVKVLAATHIHLSNTLDAKATVFVRRTLKHMVSSLYREADGLVAVSEGIRKDLVRTFGITNKIELIHNGILPPRVKTKPGLSQGKTVLTVGRLEPQKDFATLIRAFARCRKDVPDARLVIVGQGSQKEELMRLVREEKLGACVSFRGWRQDCGMFYRNAALFVLSSHREGFPYVLLEAMSYGLPVVSTDTLYGPAEILGQSTYGLLIPVGNVEKMAAVMKELLTDRRKHKRYAAKAFERVNFFSLHRMLSRYKGVIDRL